MCNKNCLKLLLFTSALLLLQLYTQTAQCAPTNTKQQQQELETAIGTVKTDNLQQQNRHKRQIWPGGFNNFDASFGGFGDIPFRPPPGNNNFARRPRQRQRQRPGEPLIFSGGPTQSPNTNTIPTDTRPNDVNLNNNNNSNVVYVNNRPIVATMAPFTARTTSSPQFLDCFGSCPTTSQYNPICASNQQQYLNEQKFECARRCGADIQIVRRGSCEGLFAMQRG